MWVVLEHQLDLARQIIATEFSGQDKGKVDPARDAATGDQIVILHDPVCCRTEYRVLTAILAHILSAHLSHRRYREL